MKLVTPHRGGVRRDQDRRVPAELMTSSEEESAMPLTTSMQRDRSTGHRRQRGSRRYARQSSA